MAYEETWLALLAVGAVLFMLEDHPGQTAQRGDPGGNIRTRLRIIVRVRVV